MFECLHSNGNSESSAKRMRDSYDWQMKNQEVMLSWAACEAVCALVGVNAAIVFHPLWFWANNRGASPGSTRAARVWKAHSAASLSRDLGFMSDDVVLDALHRLEDAGLLLRRRGRWATLWAVSDAGFELMGDVPPVVQEGVAAVAEARVAAVTLSLRSATRQGKGSPWSIGKVGQWWQVQKRWAGHLWR